jgi:hypothetical protein
VGDATLVVGLGARGTARPLREDHDLAPARDCFADSDGKLSERRGSFVATNRNRAGADGIPAPKRKCLFLKYLNALMLNLTDTIFHHAFQILHIIC